MWGVVTTVEPLYSQEDEFIFRSFVLCGEVLHFSDVHRSIGKPSIWGLQNRSTIIIIVSLLRRVHC